MGFILDSGATILCPHGGQATVVPSNTTVQVGGNFALLQTDVFTIAGCPGVPPNVPPCLSIQWVTAAMQTQVNGVPVLLSDSVGLCIGGIPAPPTVIGFQTIVQGT
jgi:hypothetical protein